MTAKKRGFNKKPGPKVKKKVRHPDRTIEELTYKQNQFVKAYTDPKGVCPKGRKTMRNATASARKAYETDNDHYASYIGTRNMTLKKVQKNIRALLDTDSIRQRIAQGVRARLEDPENKNFQPTIDYIAKINGDFAPEKQLVVTASADERSELFAKVYRISQGLETPPETDDSPAANPPSTPDSADEQSLDPTGPPLSDEDDV